MQAHCAMHAGMQTDARAGQPRPRGCAWHSCRNDHARPGAAAPEIQEVRGDGGAGAIAASSQYYEREREKFIDNQIDD